MTTQPTSTILDTLAALAGEEYACDTTVGEVAASFASSHYHTAVARGVCDAWAQQSAAVDTIQWLRANGCRQFADAVIDATPSKTAGAVGTVMFGMDVYGTLRLSGVMGL